MGRQHARRRRYALATMVAALGACAIVPAFAASLGGAASATVFATTMAASTGAPTVVAWENFDGTNGTNLNGTTTDGGAKTWSINPSGGTWTISGNAAKSTTASSSLVIDAGASSDSVVATISRNGTTFEGGLTANRNAAGTQFLTLEWISTGNGTLQLWKYNASWTSAASVTNLYPGGIATAPASITLKLTSASNNVMTGYINGTQVLTYTLTAAEQTLYKNATHQLFGIFQFTATTLTFDDFHLENP